MLKAAEVLKRPLQSFKLYSRLSGRTGWVTSSAKPFSLLLGAKEQTQ